MQAEVAILLRKELRQIPRRREAVLTAVLLPIVIFVVIPLINMWSLSSGATNVPMAGVNLPPGMAGFAGDPSRLLISFTMPMFVAIGGMIVPSVTATYTIISEKEKRTIELLLAMPISLAQIVLAKLLSVLILGIVVAVPLFVIDATAMIVLGLGDIGDALLLLFLLVAALIYSTASALVVGLLAADYRTANNLNGLLIGPTILLILGTLMFLPESAIRLPLLACGFLAFGGGYHRLCFARANHRALPSLARGV